MAKNSDPLHTLLAEFLPAAQAMAVREPPPASRITLYLLLTMVVTGVLWASLSRLDEIVMAPGRLVTPLPNLVVQPLETGIVKSIDVLVGQIVHKGEVLATLDATFTSADATSLSQRNDTLSLQATRLQSELSGKAILDPLGHSLQEQLQVSLMAERQANFAAKSKQYEETIQRLRSTLETNLQDQKSLAARVASLLELETMRESLLQKQLIARADLLEAREKRLEVERDYRLAVNKEPEIRREIEGAVAESAAFGKSWRQETMEKLAVTCQQRDEVVEQLEKAKLRSRLINLTAPADAIVLEIGKKSVGSVVKDAESLFTLVPIEATLMAELEVAPADIREIRPGFPVRIKLDAYPFQKHGTLKGRVLNVSADAFSRPTTGAGSPAFYYQVRVQLDDTRLKQVVEPTRLLPGMTLSGEIVTGTRTVISYFLYPVIRILDESLREK